MTKLTISELRSMFWSDMQGLRMNKHNSRNTTGFEEQWPRWQVAAFDAEKIWPITSVLRQLGEIEINYD